MVVLGLEGLEVVETGFARAAAGPDPLAQQELALQVVGVVDEDLVCRGAVPYLGVRPGEYGWVMYGRERERERGGGGLGLGLGRVAK